MEFKRGDRDWGFLPEMLTLVERPKKKVKKTVEGWVNVYPNGFIGYHIDEKSANSCAGEDRIACVKLTGEYEVEVDEEQGDE